MLRKIATRGLAALGIAALCLFTSDAAGLGHTGPGSGRAAAAEPAGICFAASAASSRC